jgi:hypothetical protein
MMFILRMSTAMCIERMDGFQESGSSPKANFILNILATNLKKNKYCHMTRMTKIMGSRSDD